MSSFIKSILSTGDLPKVLQQKLVTYGLEPLVIPFIRITPVATANLRLVIQAAADFVGPVIFTSQHGVNAVRTLLPHGTSPAGWELYAVGSHTAAQVQKDFGPVHVQTPAAQTLAEWLVSHKKPGEVLFFCGDQRRPELPDLLTRRHFTLREIVVYETRLTPQRYEKPFDGILFFSPSAVKSFFSVNTLPAGVQVFALGPTTAAELSQYQVTGLSLCPYPDKHLLIDEVINHFCQEISHKSC